MVLYYFKYPKRINKMIVENKSELEKFKNKVLKTKERIRKKRKIISLVYTNLGRIKRLISTLDDIRKIEGKIKHLK